MIFHQTLRSAYLFLTADDDRLAVEDPTAFRHAWAGLMILSGLWGLATTWLWHGGRWVFGQPTGLYILPDLTVIAVMLLWPYRRAAGALVDLLAGADATVRSVTAALLVTVWMMGLMVLGPNWHLQEQALPGWLAWIRPGSKIDRLLLLMPLWGAWAMLVLVQLRRPAGEPRLAAMARGGGPLIVAALMAVLLTGTIGYFSYLPWTQLTISAATILTAIGGGWILAWRRAKLDRRTLLAANLLTQLAMLLAVAANSHF